MKTMRILTAILALGAILAPRGLAQEKPKAAEEFKPITPVMPLKVQVVFSEFEGEKKVSSLPYMLFVNPDERTGSPESRVRMGLRVPIAVTGKEPSTQFQYMD